MINENRDSPTLRHAAVFGAGPMGAGIAAILANAGVSVDLFDIHGGEKGANFTSQNGLDRQIGLGAFTSIDAQQRVFPVNIKEDLPRLAQADWVIEAIVENLDIKRRLYSDIARFLSEEAILTSNTSTIPLKTLVADAETALRRRFLIAHFFNPPHVMPLVEIVCSDDTSDEVATRTKSFVSNILKKHPISCKDTPGFIANRIGCYWLGVGVQEAARLGLTMEEADAVHHSIGIPRTGVFGLLDLIGLDLVKPIWGNLASTLAESDALHSVDLSRDPTIAHMVSEGATGRKAGRGFYRRTEDGREVLDMTTGAYRQEDISALATLPIGTEWAQHLKDSPDRLSTYVWAVLSKVGRYAAEHIDAIAYDRRSVDAAMELGFGWKKGPFALATELNLPAGNIEGATS